ncbi:MAG: DoxX family protein [Gordonia sp. (in: high G+C Gram-positive bacteria)]
MSDREPPHDGDSGFQPPSPFDDAPTGVIGRPALTPADKDAFYARHGRRPGRLTRVESLDDLDPDTLEPDEVATRQIPTPRARPRRNPVPMGSPAPPTEPVTRDGENETGEHPDIPAVAETFPELARTAEPERHHTLALGEPDDLDDADPEGSGVYRTGPTAREHPTFPAASESERMPATIEPEAAPAARGTLDLGLLILRVGVGLLIGAHGLQKLFGWWGGPGLDGYRDLLVNADNPALGFDADYARPLALVGALSETIGGGLLILGLLTPIAGCAVLSVMLLASTFRITLAGGFGLFAADGGIELELILAVAAATVILTGPGLYSLDSGRGWTRRPFIFSVIWLFVAIAAAIAVWVVGNGANPLSA